MKTSRFCQDCGVPIIGELCERCGESINKPKILFRMFPVFKEELLMLKETTSEPVDQFNSLDLWVSGYFYYYKGEKVFKVVGGNIFDNPKIVWIKDKNTVLRNLEKDEKLSELEYQHRIREANSSSLKTLEETSIRFIQDVDERFKDKVNDEAISFSGGKDSTVVSHLVRKALGNEILHIFANTTLENPDTLDFLKSFAEEEKIDLLRAEPQQDFAKLVKTALIPSRIHRWCHQTLKIAPIEKLIRKILKPGDKILMFSGERREESPKRQKYEEILLNSIVSSEIVARPVLTWSSLEEWLYILGENFTFNKGYRHGLRRIGCTLCPYSNKWTEFVLRCSYPSLIENHLNLLYSFVVPRKVEKSMKDYIANGGWKTRVGGSINHPYSLLSDVTLLEEDSKYFHITLKKTIKMSVLKEYLKPLFKEFGLKLVESQTETETTLNLSKKQEAVCKIVLGGNSVHVWWLIDKKGLRRQFIGQLKKQLIKYQFCVYCDSCETICALRAIKVDAKNQEYKVDENTCNGCGDCINVNKGCVLAKSVKISKKYKLGANN